MTRIGVVTTSYPRWCGDYAGAFVEDAVRELVASGAGVEVIAAGEGEAAAAAASAGPRVHRVPVARAADAAPLFYGAGAPEALEQGGLGAWLQAGAFWLRLCHAIRARAGGWDRAVAHWLLPCGLAVRVSAPALPLTIHAHSGDVALLERLPGGAALARTLVRARAEGDADAPDIIFASNNLRERFGRLLGRAVGRVAPLVPGAGREALGPSAISKITARRALGLAEERRTVVSVGRLVPIKGYDVLLRAVAVTGARGPSAARPTVVIVGDGPERPRLARLARQLDVDLLLPGFVPRDEVALWIAGGDVYVQPSRALRSGRTEGLPTATLEALALGVPVLASATGGLTELPYGPPRLRLIPPGDARVLAMYL